MPVVDVKKLMQIRRVVLVGNLGPPLLAFARSCQRLGISTYMLEVTDGPVPSRRLSSALSGFDTISRTLVGTMAGIQAIREFIELSEADALISVSESMLLWLSEHRGRFEPDCRLLIPPHECLTNLSSKKYQIELAKQSGFSVLPTWYLNRPSDIETIPGDQYPVCIRPSEPDKISPSFKVQVIHSPDELESFMASLTELHEPIVSQPFLMLPDLKIHGMREENGGHSVFRPFLVERKFQGVTLTLMRAQFPPNTREACESFVNRAGLTGAFHFDLLYSPTEDRAYFLEINARMGGITDKAAAFGYDQPKLILEAFGHPRMEDTLGDGTSRRRVVTKRAVCRHILSALLGELTELDYPPNGRAKHILFSLRDLVFARDSVFDIDDLRGTIWFNTQGFKL